MKKIFVAAVVLLGLTGCFEKKPKPLATGEDYKETWVTKKNKDEVMKNLLKRFDDMACVEGCDDDKIYYHFEEIAGANASIESMFLIADLKKKYAMRVVEMENKTVLEVRKIKQNVLQWISIGSNGGLKDHQYLVAENIDKKTKKDRLSLQLVVEENPKQRAIYMSYAASMDIFRDARNPNKISRVLSESSNTQNYYKFQEFLKKLGATEDKSSKNIKSDKHTKNIKIVKNSHLAACPEKTIEQMVKGYFDKPKWSEGKAFGNENIEDGRILVDVKGRILYLEKPIQAHLQFLFSKDRKTFEINALEFNGLPQNILMINALISDMCEEE